MNEQIKEIVSSIVIFLSSGTGAVLIGVIAKSIISAVAAYKTKKVSRLTESDKQDIAATVTQNVLAAVSGGLKVDMSAEIDKATNSRIRAIEEKTNELVGAMNEVVACNKATMSAVGDFRTISAASREKIQSLLGSAGAKVEGIAVPEQPTVEVKPVEIAAVKKTVSHY